MFFIQIALFVMVMFGLMVWSVRAQEEKTSAEKNKPTVTSQKVQAMSQEDIKKALQNIERATEESEKMGAMCYDQVAPASELEYICPLDGEKTVYSQGSKASALVIDMVYMRSEIKNAQSLAKDMLISLDERKLCAKCSPGLSDKERSVTLVVQYADGRTIRTERVDSNDIAHLVILLKDGLVFIGLHHGSEPGLDYLEKRLKVLLGEK